MRRLSVALAFFPLLILIAVSMPAVKAAETPIWSANVSSDGTPITSPILEAGVQYRIVAKEMFWYDYANNLAADAQYYTLDGADAWNWTRYASVPGESFLKINDMYVNWGPFSNGDTGHTYTIYYTGTGASITFRLVDLIDGNSNNNNCHLPVEIYMVVPCGHSPGYWKHQFSAYFDGKGKAQESYGNLLTYTAKINSYFGKSPPDFYGYTLLPVSSFDSNHDTVFTIYDARSIFTSAHALWIELANWYNWAAGYGPYTD